jgi:hypothetical protein
MSRNLCSIKKCKNKLQDSCGLFKIPKNGSRRDLWLKYLQNEGVNVLERSDFRLCGLHFDQEEIVKGKSRTKLLPDAVPSIPTARVVRLEVK